MWLSHNLRSDADEVWANSLVKTRLKQYYSIFSGYNQPRFQLAKKIELQISLNIDAAQLWKEHERIRVLINLGKNIEDQMAKHATYPSYLDLKVILAEKILKSCIFCEHQCKINRYQHVGKCGIKDQPIISSAFAHMGEESVLVPSGTIFFCGCNFQCRFCQNSEISQDFVRLKEGKIVSIRELANIADKLADQTRNLNWVGGDPIPNIAFILEAMVMMKTTKPQVWNSNYYMSPQSWKLVNDLIDFHLPDFKYWNNDLAFKLSGISNYREVITRNISEAYNEGSGEMVIRHLVLPGCVESETLPILKWISRNTPTSLVNIMAQYHPDYKIPHNAEFRQFNQRVSKSEMQRVYEEADFLGLEWKAVS